MVEVAKANENEKLRLASERASQDAETKQKFEAEIALLKLKEEQEAALIQLWKFAKE